MRLYFVALVAVFRFYHLLLKYHMTVVAMNDLNTLHIILIFSSELERDTDLNSMYPV